MVNATVDNKPVSIIVLVNQSTTVPSNETWRVSLHLANLNSTDMEIDGAATFTGQSGTTSAQGSYLDVTLVGGQTITMTSSSSNGGIFITGFVVDS